MRKSGGDCIINNSSIAGLRYRQGDPLYAALKAAVTHYTRMSGVELGPDNIRVNSISPGAIATPIFWGGSQRANTLSEEENEKKLKKLKGNLAKAVPLNRSGLAIDIAEALLMMALPTICKVTPSRTMSPSSHPSMHSSPPVLILTPPGSLNCAFG